MDTEQAIIEAALRIDQALDGLTQEQKIAAVQLAWLVLTVPPPDLTTPLTAEEQVLIDRATARGRRRMGW